MKPMVVFFAVIAAACGSLVSHGHYAPLAHSAIIAAPVLHGQTNYVGGHAVTHEARVDVRSPAVHSTSIIAPLAHSAVVAAPLAHGAYAAPLAYSAYATPLLGAHAGYGASLWGHGSGHLLKKRSLYAAPIAYHAPAAVSHQSRVDVISRPAVVSHAVHAAPVAIHAPVVAHVAPAAVSHQSRVDIRSSPAIHATSYAYAPVVAHYAPVAHAAPLYHSAPLHYASPLSHAW